MSEAYLIVKLVCSIIFLIIRETWSIYETRPRIFQCCVDFYLQISLFQVRMVDIGILINFVHRNPSDAVLQPRTLSLRRAFWGIRNLHKK